MAVDVTADTTAVRKALADPLRWRIVELLAAEELCVCHLVEETGAPQPLVSHHLRVLRDVGVVSSSRFRYWTYYRLEPRGLRPLTERLGALLADVPAPSSRRRPCC